MNVQRDPDAILAAWLEEGPNRLPEQTRRAIAVTTRTTDQKRRSPWAPWRTPLMTSVARVAIAAIAVIAVAGGAIYFLGQSQGPVSVAPTERPTATPTASQTADAGTLLYEIKLPADALPSWDVVTFALAYVTIPADTVSEWKASAGTCCPGAKIKSMIEGTLKVVSEGPVQLIRAGASVETISAGTEIVLQPGDTLMTRNEIGETYTNAGPVELVTTDLVSGDVPVPPVPDGWVPQGLDRRQKSSLPAGAQVLRLRRLSVTAGEALSPPAGGSQLGSLAVDAGLFFSHASDDTMTVRGAANASADAYVLTQEPG